MSFERCRGLVFVAALPLIALVDSEICEAGELDAFKGVKEGRINISGGTAHVPVMTDAARNIMKANPAIKITVAGGGSGVGVQQVGEGLVDIGNTGRPLSADEQAKYGLVSFEFALDGVAVAVHPKNPVSALSSEQVRAIFSGQVTNWKEAGGKDAPIHLYNRDEASGTREVFWIELLKKGAVASSNVVPSNGAMKVAISRDPLAIGYVSIGHTDKTLKTLDLDGVAPSQANATSGTYKIARKLFMNTKGEPSGIVKSFIDYVRSPAGAKVVQKHGFIPR